MDQHPDHARQRARHGDLAGAQQRHALEAERTRGDRGKLGVEVVGGGEDAADDVLGVELVALHDRRHQLGRGFQDVLGVVVRDAGRAT
jgi:hypothetical protein